MTSSTRSATSGSLPEQGSRPTDPSGLLNSRERDHQLRHGEPAPVGAAVGEEGTFGEAASVGDAGAVGEAAPVEGSTPTGPDQNAIRPPASNSTIPTPAKRTPHLRRRALSLFTSREATIILMRARDARLRCSSADLSRWSGPRASRRPEGRTAGARTGYATRSPRSAPAARGNSAPPRRIRPAVGSSELCAAMLARLPMIPALAKSERALCSRDRLQSRSASSSSSIKAADGPTGKFAPFSRRSHPR
jgi:hypothetical protein